MRGCHCWPKLSTKRIVERVRHCWRCFLIKRVGASFSNVSYFYPVKLSRIIDQHLAVEKGRHLQCLIMKSYCCACHLGPKVTRTMCISESCMSTCFHYSMLPFMKYRFLRGCPVYSIYHVSLPIITTAKKATANVIIVIAMVVMFILTIFVLFLKMVLFFQSSWKLSLPTV